MSVMIAPLYSGYSALDFLIVALAVLMMPAMSIIAGRTLAREAPEARKLIHRYLRIISRGWLTAAVVAAAWWVQDRPFGALGLAPHLRLWDYAGFVFALVIGFLMTAQSFGLAAAPREKLERAMKTVRNIKVTPDTPGELALFMLVSLTAGVWEELVYRGFLIWFLVPLAGVTGAVVVSSLIFGLGHLYQGIRGLVTATGLGLVFAALYLVSGTLWWLIAVHAAIDIAGGLVTWRVKRVAAREGVI